VTTTLVMPASAGKWDNLLTVDANAGQVAIHDLILDGNRHKRGRYENYELEQSAPIRITNGAANIARVTLRDSVGDGIVISGGTVDVTDVEAVDCYRGGLVIVNGPATVNVERYHGSGAEWPSFVQIESNNEEPINLTIADSVIPRIELEAWGDVTITDTTIENGFWLAGRGSGAVNITDTAITLRPGSWTRRIYWARNLTFTRVHFLGSGLWLYPDVLDRAFSGQHVRFVDCTWEGDGTDEWAVTNHGDAIDRGNKITFEGTNTYTGYTAGGYRTQPGRFATVNGLIVPA
jgi:hypothetical protein